MNEVTQRKGKGHGRKGERRKGKGRGGKRGRGNREWEGGKAQGREERGREDRGRTRKGRDGKEGEERKEFILRASKKNFKNAFKNLGSPISPSPINTKFPMGQCTHAVFFLAKFCLDRYILMRKTAAIPRFDQIFNFGRLLYLYSFPSSIKVKFGL